MFKYTITQKTTLDKVVYKVYKNLAFFKDVLEANPHLKYKLILEVADIVNLPALKNKEKKSVKRLWD